jgi:signal transduction histidine kinase
LVVGFVATLFLTQAIPAIGLIADGRDVPLPLAVSAIHFLLIPVVLVAVDRLLEPSSISVFVRALVGGVAALIVGGAVAALLWSGLLPRVDRSFNGAPPTGAALGLCILGGGVSILFVGAWSLAVMVPRMFEQEKVRALQIANLELEAAQLRAQSELARLRGQLEPHFLLNTLNLISGLVGIDVDKARRTIANLGDLLRDSLQSRGEYQSVGGEIEWLKRYSEILVARHGSVLSFEWDVEAAARDARLPRLLLQPLLENAIVHGALRVGGKARVAVQVRVSSAGRVEISIEDNGPGPARVGRAGALGIAIVRRRLELTSPEASFELATGPSGTRALLSLPHVRYVAGANER